MGGLANAVCDETAAVEEAMQSVVDAVVDAAVDGFDIADDSAVFREVGEAVMSGFVNAVGDEVAGAEDAMRDAVDAVVDTAEDGFGISGGQSTTFREMGEAVMGGLVGAVSDKAAAAVDAFRGMFDKVLGAAESFSQNYLSVLNNMVSQAQSLFSSMQNKKQGMQNMSQGMMNMQIHVPRFAKGGVAYAPTLAIVGDNPGASTDPEIIAPLSKVSATIMSQLTGFAMPAKYTARLANRNTKVELGDGAIAKIINGLSENFTMATAGASGGGPLQVSLYVNGNDLAEVMIDDYHEAARRKGIDLTPRMA